MCKSSLSGKAGSVDESVERKKLSWREVWGIEVGRIRFMLEATHDSLPSSQNLSQWIGEDPTCPSCPCFTSALSTKV